MLGDWEAGVSGPGRESEKASKVRSAPRFVVPYSKGNLTGYSPAACRAYRAAHSCLWDWELCRPPERALGSRAASPAGFGAFAPGSLSLGFRVLGLV